MPVPPCGFGSPGLPALAPRHCPCRLRLWLWHLVACQRGGEQVQLAVQGARRAVSVGCLHSALFCTHSVVPTPAEPHSDDPRLSQRGLFAHPPRPSALNTTGLALMRDLLAIEVRATAGGTQVEPLGFLRGCRQAVGLGSARL